MNEAANIERSDELIDLNCGAGRCECYDWPNRGQRWGCFSALFSLHWARWQTWRLYWPSLYTSSLLSVCSCSVVITRPRTSLLIPCPGLFPHSTVPQSQIIKVNQLSQYVHSCSITIRVRRFIRSSNLIGFCQTHLDLNFMKQCA